MKAVAALKKIIESLLIVSVLMLNIPLSSFAQQMNESKDNEMAPSVREYMAGLRDLNRAYYDMNYTILAQKEAAYFKSWKQKMQLFQFDKFSQGAKVDYILLSKNIERNESDLADQQKSWDELQPVLPFADQILELVKMRHWGSTPDAKLVATIYDSIGKEIQTAQEKLSQTNLTGIHSLPIVMNIMHSLRGNLRDVYNFYNGYDPSFTWWVATSFRQTDSLFDIYTEKIQNKISNNLASNDGSGIPGVPIGLAKVKQSLNFEMIPYSADELVNIAKQEYDWCLKEMKKASAQMGYKDDWHAALEAVKNDYVPVGQQPALIDSLQNEALDFVAAHKLIDIPPLAKETWTMKMMSPKEQLINPFFYGGILISISYPTNTMSYSDKLESLRGNNIYFSRATVFHELLPGHYLQAYMNERYKTYRRPFQTAFWTEGWAFYWEMLLWDNGFDKTPEQKIGALYWRMTRCARIIFTMNFHLGHWTPKQCVDYLVNSAGLERKNAEAEVRRSFGGEYDPLYQIAYMIGALQFRALHH
ncbi:DUF885 family protein, partial [Arachidicoccus sp.]|uniref:DUF885 family protein n=1 Tax=Arachidicoccus sp. TaxID=1872624 RepID=UPI003D1E6296